MQAALSRYLVRPCALAGNLWELPAAAATVLAVTITFGLELLTPDDVISTSALLPLVIAVWVLSTRLVAVVASVTAVQYVFAVAIESSHRPTMVVIGVVGSLILLLVRLYAVIHPVQDERDPHRAIRNVSSGTNSERAGEFLSGVATLSRRELEVAQLASRGHTAPDIGRILHIGERTVETHIAHAYSKLNIRSKAELIRMSGELKQAGLVNPREPG